MREQKAFDNGMLAGFFFSFAAFAGNWLITLHPDASPLRTEGVWAQALVCLGIGLCLLRRRRPKSSPSPSTAV
jgi:hypothetical protein